MQKKRVLIVLLLVNALLLAAFGAAFAGYRHYADLLLPQQTAERWRGDSGERFSQLSCFRPVGRELSLNDVVQFRQRVESALLTASLEEDAGTVFWVDAVSARSRLTVRGDRGAAETLACAIDGQFFTFHPLQLISGSYISGEDLARDGVVLTRELAWQLFGATDIAGMEVTIGDRPYLIAGVVEAEQDKASLAAESETPCIYLHLDALYGTGDRAIDCYELVLADPVRNFAKNTMTEHMPEGGEIVENSKRYTASALSRLITDFGKRSMNTYGILYPYWENAARYTEDMAAMMLFLAFLAGVIPALSLLAAVVLLYIAIGRKGKRIANRIRGY